MVFKSGRNPSRPPLKGGELIYLSANRSYQLLETLDGLGCLGEEIDRAGEIEPVELVDRLDDNGGIVRLALQTDDFGVTGLTIDDNLRRNGLIVLVLLIACTDTVLQFLHHRTGGIDDFDTPLLRNPIGGRRFAVCAEQHARVSGHRA